MKEVDEIVSQRILFSDKEEEYHKDEDEAAMSYGEDEVALGLSKTELTDKSGQEIERQLVKIVKTEPEESFADTKMQHSEEVLERNQVENKCLKY